jgi:hypothetical protein
MKVCGQFRGIHSQDNEEFIMNDNIEFVSHRLGSIDKEV